MIECHKTIQRNVKKKFYVDLCKNFHCILFTNCLQLNKFGPIRD